MSPDEKKLTKEEIAEREMLDDIEDASEAINLKKRKAGTYLTAWALGAALNGLFIFLAILTVNQGWIVAAIIMGCLLLMTAIFGTIAYAEGDLTTDRERKALKKAERRYRDYLTTGVIPPKKTASRYDYDY